MLEREMDIWDAPPDAWIGIPTNGTVKFDGRLVMGRGVAAEAKARLIGIDRVLGFLVQEHGNDNIYLPSRSITLCGVIDIDIQRDLVFSFPVKTGWRDIADLSLIAASADSLRYKAMDSPDETFYLPRPGCGNGRLLWSDVNPVIEYLPDNVIVVHKNLPTLVEVPVAHAKG